jgi:hypothetical protein
VLNTAARQMREKSPRGVGVTEVMAEDGQVLSELVEYYLSPAHRDTRSPGSPLPFLAADAPPTACGLTKKLAAGVRRPPPRARRRPIQGH